MGKLRFSKIVKFFALALLSTATAIAVVAVLSSPATAKGGGGGDSDDYPWDTDNLKIGSTYSARSFAVPHYGNQGDPARTGSRTSGLLTLTENHSPCQPSVMDGFFQNSASQPRNDLPKLEKTAATENKWKETPGHICDVFVTAQNLAISRYSANGGFWLDSEGSLRKGGFGGWMTATRDATASLGYTTWDQKGSLYSISGYSVPGGGVVYYTRAQAPSATDDGYVARVDAGRTVGVGIPSGGLTLPNRAVRKGSITQNAGVKTFSTEPISHHNGTIHLPQDKSVGGHAGSWCPAKSHPRGEDALIKIGSGTGRTLSSLSTQPKVRLADLFWCRSDVRYPIWYAPQSVAGTTCGTAGARSCPSGVTIPTEDFRAWGRVNCYYTALEITSNGKCVYPHPIPQCTDNGSKRDFAAAELDGRTRGESFSAAADGTTDCASAAADPPQLAGFTADACVTASLEIYENRVVGSAAEPGVPASDRTLAVATGRTAWDLDVTSAHPLTASPPRDATAGTGDPDGCADGSEGRADHASSPADAARSQSPAPSYAASDRTDTAAPPNDADGDIDYSGAAKNMAHRYASRVAENTCAAKLAEAEAELSLLELREDGFAQWLSDYKTAVDTNASRYSSYTRTPQQSGAGLAILRFNDTEANKATYASLLATRYTNLSSALSAAKTAYDTATDRTAGSSRAAVIATSSNSGCIAHYTAEITRLKTLFSSAETSATGNGAAGIKEEQNAVTQTRLVSPPAVSVTTTVNSYSVPDISAVESRRESRTVCLDEEVFGGCWRAAADGETCMVDGVATSNCPGRTRVEVTVYYTCPGGRYTVSGTVSGTYKTARRSSSFSATYAAASRGESTSSVCPGFAVQSGATYASGAAAYVRGTPGTASSLPSVATASAPGTLRALGKASLLGSYYLSHGDRANLEASAAADRNTAGSSLSVSVGSVPSGSPQKIEDYQTAYKTAYDTAFSQAEGHMSGTAWNSFDWRYQTSTLTWGSYQEDPATTYSASTATPRDGTGCDLVSVASDGSVSVEATRLDYETSSYGKSSVYGARTDAQRTCEIRRTRTPELLLEYQPSVPSGTDTSKAASSFYVDYQPTPAAERFKLYDEAEVFAVKAFLADRAPVLCYQPGEALVAHVAAKGVDAVNKAVFRHASGFAGGNKKHCYRHPTSVQLGTPPKPAFAFFDDTAHSTMASVNVVWQQPNPKIVSKLGSADDLKMMANTVSLVASSPVAYADATRTSSFYGTYYTFPTTGSSVESPSG